MSNAYEEIVNPEDKEEARDLALLASNILAWAGPSNLPFDEALATAWKYLDQAAAFKAEQIAMAITPVLVGLAPAELSVPGPDTELVVQGTGFNAKTVINWNGGDEATEFVSETELRTVVKPGTVQAPLPFTLPVYAHHGSLQSNALDFTFTAPARRERHGE